MEMETLYKTSNQSIGHNIMRASQKSPKDLQT
jgi:hypothetical protein